MHLIERYALAIGNLGIDEPFIDTQFYPLEVDNYITIHNSSGADAKNYSYWNDVITFALPVLRDMGIKVVQIGERDEPKIKNAYDLRGQTTIRQLSQIIKNAKLHLGNDSFPTHCAAFHKVPLVSLYSTSYKENCSPYFCDPEKMRLLEPEDELKPSFSLQEHPKRIDSIMPERILEAIRELTDWDMPKIKSHFIGEKYSNEIFEAVVGQPIPLPQSVIVNVRMDYLFDEQALAQILQQRPISIVTDRPINLNLLNAFRQNLAGIIYICTGTEEEEKFLRSAQQLCQVLLTSRAKQTEFLKLKYMDIGDIHPVFSVKPKLPKKKSNLYYRTNKLILRGPEVFATKEDLEKNRPMNNLFMPFNYKDISEDIAFGYVFEME